MAKKLIFSFKYKPYLKDLIKVLSTLFYESIIQKEELIKELGIPDQFFSERSRTDTEKPFDVAQGKNTWVLVPIPLHSSKLRKRGYNQSEILAREIGKRFNMPVQNILKRTRDTKTQVGLKVEERRKNIRNAFQIVDRKSSMVNIVLVDDVVTTGSTLLEAANILKREGVKKVIALTLARD